MILGAGTPYYGHCFEEIDAAVTALESRRAGTVRTVVFNEKHHPASRGTSLQAPPDSVIFNLENVPGQVNPALWAKHEIWDASLQNISRYPSGLNVTHVPMGYEQSMKRFERRPPADRDIDVVFCGFLNERRIAVLEDLKKRGIHVAVPTYDTWGKDRDDVIARAKLALDMRYYEDGIFPTLRTLHLVANGMPVVSETSPETPPWALENVPYSMLADRIEELLSNDPEMHDLAIEAEIILKKHPLVLPDEILMHKQDK